MEKYSVIFVKVNIEEQLNFIYLFLISATPLSLENTTIEHANNTV